MASYILTILLTTLHVHHSTRHPIYSSFYMLTILLITLPRLIAKLIAKNINFGESYTIFGI